MSLPIAVGTRSASLYRLPTAMVRDCSRAVRMESRRCAECTYDDMAFTCAMTRWRNRRRPHDSVC